MVGLVSALSWVVSAITNHGGTLSGVMSSVPISDGVSCLSDVTFLSAEVLEECERGDRDNRPP